MSVEENQPIPGSGLVSLESVSCLDTAEVKRQPTLQFSRGEVYSGLENRLYPDHMTRGTDRRLYPGQEPLHYTELDNSGRYRSYKDSSGDQGDVDSCDDYHLPLPHSYHHSPHYYHHRPAPAHQRVVIGGHAQPQHQTP